MSIKVMTMVFDRYPSGGNERVLALALADHSDDDGTHIWPSLDRLAIKTLTNRRTVQRMIAIMVASGWLEPLRRATGRPGATNEYRISPVWIAGGALPERGDKLPPLPMLDVDGTDDVFPASEVIHTGDIAVSPLSGQKVIHTGDKSGERGDTQGPRGDIAVSPDPSYPSLRTNTPLPPEGGESGFQRIFDTYPKKANRMKAVRKWNRMAPNAATQDLMLAAIDVQRRTPRWRGDAGRYVPDFGNWLQGRCWLDEVEVIVAAEWWTDTDSIKAMGSKLGLAFTLSALGNAYTDDRLTAHWHAYRARVFVLAGDGPWSPRQAA